MLSAPLSLDLKGTLAMQFIAERLFDGSQIKHQQFIDVVEGKIVELRDANISDKAVSLKGLLSPSFIDVQVNGGGGVLFNNTPTFETLIAMTKAHQHFGTGWMLPTLITDNKSTMDHAANAISEALKRSLPGVLGIHFEGPHLSEGRRGIHPSQHIRPFTDADMRMFTRKDIGQVCVTLAPENVPIDIIKELVNENVLVCLGHSNASDEQTFDALSAGAKGFTHLFNAMSPLQGRSSGMVGAALLNDNAYCGLIADLEHVSATSCKLAIKCKTASKMMLVTDAMAHVGSNESIHSFAGMDITRRGNKLTIANGTLAGSALDMLSAVKNAVTTLGCSLEEALRMATTTPAEFLNIGYCKGKVAEGQDADWVLLDGQLNLKTIFYAGNCSNTLQVTYD